MKPAVSRNIGKLYVIQALTQALFVIPIIVLFWRSHGLSLTDIMLLQSGFALTIFILEIPTGYLADRWGRKNTIVLGCCFGALAYLTYATGTNFWNFMLAEVLIGVGASLLSGTIEALTYDSLLSIGEEGSYRRVAGNQAFFEFNTEALSGILGGLLGAVSLALPLWLTIVPMLTAVFVALTLTEPPRHRMQEPKHWRAIWDVSVHTLLRHRGLRGITLLYGLVSTMSLMFFWFFQPYQVLVGVPVALFGITHAVTLIAGACAAKSVPWFEKKVDDRTLVMIVAAMAVGCYLALSFPPALPLLLFFVVERLAWHFMGPLTLDMMNRMTTSDVRATVLSVRSFGGRLIFVCVSPFVGALADARTIPYALFVTGIVGAVVLVLTFFSMRTVWKEIPS